MSETVLLDSIVRETSHRPNGVQVVRFSLSGEPHAAAIVDAVAAEYQRRTGRPPVTDDDLEDLTGRKVSLLRVRRGGYGSSSIVAAEGTIFPGTRGPALLPKGHRRNGHSLGADTILDVEPGYGRTSVLAHRVGEARAPLPPVHKLTSDRLHQLPTRGSTCTLAVFGTWRLPDTTAPGAIWLLHSYLPEDDIAEGVLLLRPEYGVSEHGSVYGRQLLTVGGEITGAPRLSLAAALDLTGADYDDALRTVRPTALPTAA